MSLRQRLYLGKSATDVPDVQELLHQISERKTEQDNVESQDACGELVLEVAMVDAEELGAAATSANEWTEINLDSVVGTLTVVSHEETASERDLTPLERQAYSQAVCNVLCPLLEEAPKVAEQSVLDQLRAALVKLLADGRSTRDLGVKERQLLYQFMLAQCKLHAGKPSKSGNVDTRVFYTALSRFVKDLEDRQSYYSASDMQRYVLGFLAIVKEEVAGLRSRPVTMRTPGDFVFASLQVAEIITGESGMGAVSAEESRRRSLAAKMIDRLMLRFRASLSAEPPSSATVNVARRLQLLRHVFGVNSEHAEEVRRKMAVFTNPHLIAKELEHQESEIRNASSADFPDAQSLEAWQQHRLSKVHELLAWTRSHASGSDTTLTLNILRAKQLDDLERASVYVEVQCGQTRWVSSIEPVTSDRESSWLHQQVTFDLSPTSEVTIRLIARKDYVGDVPVAKLILNSSSSFRANESCSQWFSMAGMSPVQLLMEYTYMHASVYKPHKDDQLAVFCTLVDNLLGPARPKTNNFVDISADMRWLLSQFGLRYGLTERAQMLVLSHALLSRWQDRLSFYMLLHQTLISLRDAPEPFTLDQQREMIQVCTDIQRTVRNRIQHFHTVFAQNKPHGALAQACELFRVVTAAIGQNPQEELLACIGKAHMTMFETELLETAASERTMQGLYEAPDLVQLCGRVSEAIQIDETFFEQAFPPDINLVQLSTANYLKLLIEKVSVFCRVTGSQAKDASSHVRGQVFEVFRRLLRMEKVLREFSPGLPLDRQLTRMFHPFFRAYLDQLSPALTDMISKACEIDKFVPLPNARHSSSMVDLMDCVRQTFSLLKEFSFPSKFEVETKDLLSLVTVEEAMAALSGAVAQVANHYAAHCLHVIRSNHVCVDPREQTKWALSIPANALVAINNLQIVSGMLQEFKGDVFNYLRQCTQHLSDVGSRELLEHKVMNRTLSEALFSLRRAITDCVEQISDQLAPHLTSLTLCLLGDVLAVKQVLDDKAGPRVKLPCSPDEYLVNFDLPLGEECVAVFPCTYFPRRGVMMLTYRYAVFGLVPNSSVRVTIPLKEVTAVHKLKSFSTDNQGYSLAICTSDRRSITFTSLTKRDKCFNMLVKQASGAGARMHYMEESDVDDNVDRLVFPLLQVLDSLMCSLADHLYSPVLRKFLLRFWGIIEEVILRFFTGDGRGKPITEEQRDILKRALEPLYDFFHDEAGIGLPQSYLMPKLVLLNVAVVAGRYLEPMPSSEMIAHMSKLHEKHDAAERMLCDRILEIRAREHTTDKAATQYVERKNQQKSEQEQKKKVANRGPLLRGIMHALMEP